MVEWIMTCVSFASFTIGINGERHRYFKSGRGLRQGDLISPYLFTLVTEVFSLILARKVEERDMFKFHKGCTEMKLTHLSFPDDLLVFCHWDENSVSVIKDALLEFSKTLPFKVRKLLVKYLGIPLLAKSLGVKECKCLMDKVKNKVFDWKNKFLSYVGRLQLIASILSTMQAYWAAMIKKIVCKPKCEGCVGLRQLEEWNDVLLTKQIWRIISKKDSMWLKWVNVVRLKGKSFWDISEDRNDSCTWKALLGMKYKVRPFLFTVGNGKDIAMWSDNWCTIGHLSQYISNRMLFDARIKESYGLVDMIDNGSWNWPEEWLQQVPMLINIHVSRLNKHDNDYVKWMNSEGKLIEFNIKNAWKMNMSNILNDWKDLIEKIAEYPCNNAIRSVVRRIVLATAVYYIWKEINSRIFADSKMSIDNVLQKIMESLLDWPWEGSVFDGCNRECVKDESSWSTQNTDKGGSFVGTYTLGVGINYGQIANNLPPTSHVSTLLKSLNISRVKLYDADPKVLSSFTNTNVEFIIGLGNEYLPRMQDPQEAQIWIQQNVQPYLSQTKITCITVGNEILGGQDTQLPQYLYPAMKSMYEALVNLGLNKQVYITTAHSLQILATSFPPSQGAFREDLVQYLQPILAFHAQTNSPFLINVYPYFAYKNDPNNVPLEYVLFEPNAGAIDPNTNLKYDNMLYAQIDAVYSAIRALNYDNILVQISETGWPSKGDENEFGATVQNAGIYHKNLIQRMQQRQGTPANPSQPIDIYVFALFNENMKPGPTSERNYGLYYPDGTPVYNLGVASPLPRMDFSASSKNVIFHSSLCVT
ncbi:glucan endo-1,3-beta-glucosidase 14-like protein [Tanacetum coccineum]